jgi:hypothetical protein
MGKPPYKSIGLAILRLIESSYVGLPFTAGYITMVLTYTGHFIRTVLGSLTSRDGSEGVLKRGVGFYGDL